MDAVVDVTTGANCVQAKLVIAVDVLLGASWRVLERKGANGGGADPDVLLLRTGDADDVYVDVALGS